MSEFQLAPVINFQLPVYGIKKSADAAYDIFSLNTNLKIQCKLMVIYGHERAAVPSQEEWFA